MAIPFLKGIDVAGAVDLSNLTIDGTQGTDGQVLTSTGTGIAWEAAGGTSETAERIEVTVKNVSGGSLSKGTVVHASPSANPPNGNVIEVIAADYDDSTKMPAIGILNETIANEAEGSAVMMGAVSGIDTSSFSIGDELYVGNLGAFTNSKPATAGQLIQKIAVVIKSHASNGLIKIFGAGRSNDVPLPLYIDNTNQRVGIGTDSPTRQLTVFDSTGSRLALTGGSSANCNILFGDTTDDNKGSIRFANSDSSVEHRASIFNFKAQGSSALYINSSGNVGIGTTSPAGKLEVNGGTGVATSGGTLIVRQDGDTSNDGIALTSSNSISHRMFKNAGGTFLMGPSTNADAFALDLNGNVGIGTSSPLDLLHIKSSTTDARMILDGASGFDAELKFYEDGNAKYTVGYDSASANFVIGTTNVDTNQRLVIGSSGNVGIGTASPDTKLHVEGNLLVDAYSVGEDNGIFFREGFLTIDQPSITVWDMSNSGASPDGLSLNAQDGIRFRENGGEVARFKDGNFGIGTATPSQKLDVNGNVTADRYYGNTSTVYYVDPASRSNLSTLVVGSTGANSSGYGLDFHGHLHMHNKEINYVNQLHFNDNVRFYDNSDDSYLNYKYGDATTGGIKIVNGGGDTKGYIYAEGAGFGLLDNDGAWAVRTQTGSNPLILYTNGNAEFYVYESFTQSPGSSRAPIFYDSDNTSYYVNPASTSIVNTVTANDALQAFHIGIRNSSSSTKDGISLYNGAVGGEPTYGLMFTGTSGSGTHGGVTGDWATYFTMNNDSSRGWIFRKAGITNSASISAGGVATFDTSVNSPIFYDSNDTNYYVDPASTSNLNALNVGGSAVWTSGNDGSGSTLDADLLDGQHGSHYLNYNNLTNKPTIPTNYLRDDAFDSGIGLYLQGGSFNAGTDTETAPLVIDEEDFILTKDGSYLRRLIGKTSDQIQIGQGGTGLISSINFLPGTAGNSAVKINSNTVWNAGNDGSGSGLDADYVDGYHASNFFRRIHKTTATVGPGWMTVAQNVSGRNAGEIVVTDADSGDHAYIRIEWMRSYSDSNFTVLNCGGHSNRITGARVLYETSNNTYGTKKLQVYVTTSSNYEVNIYEQGDIDDYGTHSVVTPVIQNTISGYALHGNQLENLDTFGFAAEEGILSGGDLAVMGNQTFGIPGNGSNTSGRWLSFEGNTDSSGEGSGRLFFSEHNTSTTDMDDYGMSIGYRGGSTSVTTTGGNTWTGLSAIGNGEWGMWGHDNSLAGTLIMAGPRTGNYVKISQSGGIRAQIFYDLNNTSYYVNPASGSKLYQLAMFGHSINSGQVMLVPDKTSYSSGSGFTNMTYRKLNSTLSYTPETVVSFQWNTTQKGSISMNAYSTQYNTSSDYRLKENEVLLTNGIQRVKQLQPKRFNFIGFADQTLDGFFAHEVSSIVPEAVTGEKDAVDENNNPIHQSIDQSKIVPLLTAALKEAIAKIEDLETRVQSLENQ